MTWAAVLATAAGCYGLKLAGWSLPPSVLEHERLQRFAAQLGKKTAVVERDKVGGRCLNYACIPAKAVLRSADVLDEVRQSEQYGVNVSGVELDYGAVQGRRDFAISSSAAKRSADMMRSPSLRSGCTAGPW